MSRECICKETYLETIGAIRETLDAEIISNKKPQQLVTMIWLEVI